MTISQTITALPTAPDPVLMTTAQFSAAAAASVLAQKAMTPEINTWATQANALAAGLNAIAAGTAAAIPYTFSTTTTDADPGAGYLRLDNATQNTATTIRADLSGSDASVWTDVLNTFDDSTSTIKGHIMLTKLADATKWLLFSVSALASPTGYKNITVAIVGSSAASPFANNDSIILKFTRTGDKGEAGISIPLDPIAAPNVITDALSAQPGTTVIGEVYLVGAGASGAVWTGKEGRLMQATDLTGTVWIDVLGRVVAIGDRLGIAMEHGTVAGSFTAHTTHIAEITNATPGSYAYTFTVPVAANIVLVNGVNSSDYGHGYMLSGVTLQWVEIFLPGAGITEAAADLRYAALAGLSTQLFSVASGVTTAHALRVAQYGSGVNGWTYQNNVTDPTNDIDIAAGSGLDSTSAYFITGAAKTKQSDVAWAVGNAAGGLDTGAVGNNDYYIWVIVRSDTGVVDYLFSLSSTAPTMPASYDYKRLIGWFKRAAGTIAAFHTYEIEGGGLKFSWDLPTTDVNLLNTLTTTRRTDAVRVPLNFSVEVTLMLTVWDGTSFGYAWVGCPDVTDFAPAAGLCNAHWLTTVTHISQLTVRTSAAGLIAARSSVATTDTYELSTLGFTLARRL